MSKLMLRRPVGRLLAMLSALAILVGLGATSSLAVSAAQADDTAVQPADLAEISVSIQEQPYNGQYCEVVMTADELDPEWAGTFRLTADDTEPQEGTFDGVQELIVVYEARYGLGLHPEAYLGAVVEVPGVARGQAYLETVNCQEEEENRPPEPKNKTVEADLSQNSVEFTLEAADADGDTLESWSVDQPTNGTVEPAEDFDSPHFVFYPETRGESVVDWSVSDGINDPQFAEVTFQVTETITPPEPSFDPETGLLTLPAVDGLVYHVDGEPRQDPYQVCGTSVVEVFGADQWVELNGTTSWTYAYECDTPDPDPTWGGDTSRIGGEDRYHTASLFGQWWGQQGSTCVAIAQGREAPDASVGGGMLAARSGMSAAAASCDSTVVLLVRGDSIPSVTAAALAHLQPPAITVLGGEAAVSEQVRQQLRQYTDGSVVRIGGNDRYQTAAAIARTAVASGMDTSTVFLANGEGKDLANALSAAALKQHPVLLVRGDGRLPSATAAALAEFNPTNIVVVGNTDSVSEAVAQAAGATGRVDGASHEEVSINLMLAYLDSAGGVFVVRDNLYPDGLATSALSGPVVTVRGDVASDLLVQSLEDLGTAQVIIGGGPAAVSSAFETSLREASRLE